MFEPALLNFEPETTRLSVRIIKDLGEIARHDLTHPLIYACAAIMVVTGLFRSMSENFSMSGLRRPSGIVGMRS